MEILCQSCGNLLRIPDDIENKIIRCPSCKHLFTYSNGQCLPIHLEEGVIRASDTAGNTDTSYNSDQNREKDAFTSENNTSDQQKEPDLYQNTYQYQNPYQQEQSYQQEPYQYQNTYQYQEPNQQEQSFSQYTQSTFPPEVTNAASFKQSRAIVPTKVHFDSLLSNAWDLFAKQMGTLILGCIVMLVCMLAINFTVSTVSTVLQFFCVDYESSVSIEAEKEKLVNFHSAQPLNQTNLSDNDVISQYNESSKISPASLVAFCGIELIANIVQSLIIMWLTIGSYRFLLTAARGRNPSLWLLFSGGNALIRYIANTIIMALFIIPVCIICTFPAILILLYSEMGNNVPVLTAGIVAYIVGLIALLTILLIVTFRWAMSLFIIADTDAMPIESLRVSRSIMKGNWISLFLTWCVSIALVIAGYCACCVGLIFAIPLIYMIMVVFYLTASGQLSSTQNEDWRPYV